MVGLSSRKLKGCLNVFFFQIGVILQDALWRHTGCEEVQDILHANSHPPNTRASSALGRIDRDAREQAHGGIVLLPAGEDQCYFLEMPSL